MTDRYNVDLATLKLPRIAAGALGLAYLGSFFSASLHINMLAAALSVGFILQALAVLHFITRGKKWRTPFLVVFYIASTFVLGGISHIALLLFGLADVIFNFRNLKD
jgi:predicted membrane protein